MLSVVPVLARTSGALCVFNRLYHKNVVDHYSKPRNVGSFDKTDPNVGTGLVGKFIMCCTAAALESCHCCFPMVSGHIHVFISTWPAARHWQACCEQGGIVAWYTSQHACACTVGIAHMLEELCTSSNCLHQQAGIYPYLPPTTTTHTLSLSRTHPRTHAPLPPARCPCVR